MRGPIPIVSNPAKIQRSSQRRLKDCTRGTTKKKILCTRRRHESQCYRLLSIPSIPPVLPCMLPATLSRRPRKLSFFEIDVVVFFRGLLRSIVRASISSCASSDNTLGPPYFLSSSTCWREPAACSSALPLGANGCWFSKWIAKRSEALRSSSS